MTVTKILGAQSGIQYSGVHDRSEAAPSVQLLNGVIVGQFKRGRFDKPFKVTSENIRAKLGYDPTNKDYVAVEDALASGAPFVWVQRIADEMVDEEETEKPPKVVHYLTIDDKGMLPSDNIYSGTIEPPLPGIRLGFNIQQYTPNGSNGRVFNIYSDPEGLMVSEDGSTWWIDKSTIASWWGRFPTESDFKTPATYELLIHENTGYDEPEVIPARLKYVVQADQVNPEKLTGFRIRLPFSISKSESLHLYNPSAVGSNGEKMVNLANLFDSTESLENGWTEWSRELTFEDVNYPSSNGGVTLIFNASAIPNYWIDMNGIFDLISFFEAANREFMIEYLDNR